MQRRCTKIPAATRWCPYTDYLVFITSGGRICRGQHSIFAAAFYPDAPGERHVLLLHVLPLQSKSILIPDILIQQTWYTCLRSNLEDILIVWVIWGWEGIVVFVWQATWTWQVSLKIVVGGSCQSLDRLQSWFLFICMGITIVGRPFVTCSSRYVGSLCPECRLDPTGTC